MSNRHESFEVGERPRVSIRLGSGSVRIVPGQAGRIDVDARGRSADSVTIDQAGGLVSVRQEQDRSLRGSLDVTFSVPPGTGVVASLASATLDVEVPLEDLNVSAASGDLRVGDVRREVLVKTASGDVEIATIEGKGKLNAASGDIRIRTVHGDSTINTASGDIDIDEARGDLVLRSVSGDITVARYLGSDIITSTVSGDTTVRIPPGRSADVDLRSLSGRIKLPSSPGSGQVGGDKIHVRIRFKSVSGDFELATPDS
ncbi:hypothetical protein BMS3Abin02_00255 [bacterium BMS3Abin02]|nr:hypothetical protein BMS3Abin02_00255 [bacterium BMS3Abin02]GBE22884.1 hypothetical protein BMS3Bbin01_02261 [bacterium BMS3Bbin01]HDH27020.1 hypothetical protein [Actinomycetota bacterium]